MYSTRRVLTFFCEAKNASSLASKLKLGKLDEVQRRSVISFPVMSKDVTVCHAELVSASIKRSRNEFGMTVKTIFEITKEGRKLMREYLQTHWRRRNAF